MNVVMVAFFCWEVTAAGQRRLQYNYFILFATWLLGWVLERRGLVSWCAVQSGRNHKRSCLVYSQAHSRLGFLPRRQGVSTQGVSGALTGDRLSSPLPWHLQN